VFRLYAKDEIDQAGGECVFVRCKHSLRDKCERKKHESSLLMVVSDAGSTPAASTTPKLLKVIASNSEAFLLCSFCADGIYAEMKEAPMSNAPIITIYVRHGSDCKCRGDEFAKRCVCPKHLRWTANGKQQRRTAGTRSWTEAEEIKRDQEDQLAGRSLPPQASVRDLHGCIDVFMQDKRVQGVTPNVISKYTRLLKRLQVCCKDNGIHTMRGLTRDVLTGFCSTWEVLYPRSITRAKLRERLRSFLRYCYEAQWLDRVPPVPKFKIVEPETQPLTPEEYVRLIDAVYITVENKDTDSWQRRVAAFLQLMRWSGPSIRDAMTPKRSALKLDKAKGIFRITTKRAKTGVPVSIPIPEEVAEELLALQSVSSQYFFWSGIGKPQSATSNWGQRYIAPVFKNANIFSDGNMLSHRLLDTFAVDSLSKGVPMEEVSRLLGHTSIRTTEKSYEKWSKSRQDRVDTLVTGTRTIATKRR
jgi:integrase/recombinase XerD